MKKIYQKAFALAFVSVLCISSFCACGKKAPRTETQISVEQGKAEEPENVDEEVMEDKQQTSSIDKSMLDLLGNKKEILKDLEEAGIGLKEKDSGVEITTQSSEDRELADSIVSTYIKNLALNYTKDGIILNYDVEYGFVYIYGEKGKAKEMEELVNYVIPYMAFGRKVYDGKSDWLVQVLVYDYKSGENVKSATLSETTDKKISLDGKDWDGIKVSKGDSDVTSYQISDNVTYKNLKDDEEYTIQASLNFVDGEISIPTYYMNTTFVPGSGNGIQGSIEVER